MLNVGFSRCNNYRANGPEDTSVFVDSVPKNYLKLLNIDHNNFSDSSRGIVFRKTTINKFRSPISSFLVLGKFYLQIYMMNPLFKGSLKAAIKESYIDARTDINNRYLLDDNTDMEFLYHHFKPKITKQIFIDIFGSNTKTLEKNDSISYYHSQIDNFWIKYNQKDENDIYGNLKQDVLTQMPIEIMFLKSKNKVYLLILSSKTSSTALKENLLKNLLKPGL